MAQLTPEQEARIAAIRSVPPLQRISAQQRASMGGMSPPPAAPAVAAQPTAPASPAIPPQIRVAGANPSGATPNVQVAPSGAAGSMGPPLPPAGPPSPSRPAPGIFDQLDDETAQTLMSLGDKERQMRYAEMLRDQGAPTGMHVNQGRTYVAASPLEHAASAYGRFKGKREADKVGEEQTAGRMKILDILRGR